MKHKTWFRLVLQAIGVLLVGFGAPELIRDVGGYLLWRYQQSAIGFPAGGPATIPEWLSLFLQVSPPLLQTAFGIYLMTGATWLLDKFIPSNRPYCPECGYDLTHNSGLNCSECGTRLPSAPPREGEASET